MSQLIHQYLLKNPALLHGSSFQHGIKAIPPDTEDMFAKQINATTISLPASHASYVSHMTTMLSDPFELPLIEDRTNGTTVIAIN